ncbi:MAG: MFS transporter [Oscillospiraceae bacterium]|nr:MFS transporter [Oscillospiraceae bacterium]
MENNKPVLTDSIINLNALSNGLNTMAFTVPTLYLTMFMTDYLGISPVAMGTGMLIAKTFDFIISLVAGVIIEKANMKHGKYLSWIRLLTATLFFGNIIQMLDTTAFVGNSTVRLCIVMVGYMMFHGSMNFNAASRAALIPKLAGSDMAARKKITARQAQVGSAVSIISSAITLPCVQFVQRTTGSETMGYFLVALVFSTSFAITNMIYVKKAQPFDPYDPSPAAAKSRPTIGQMVSSVVTNKQMLILFLAFTITGIGNQVYAGITTYFFRCTGTFGKYTIVLTARSICAFLASMVAPSIGKKLGKKGALIFGWALNAAAGLLIYFFALNKDGSANLIAMAVAMCAKQAANYFYMVFTANYWLDCGEYGYATTGVDNRTMAVTVMNWPTKISMALGGSLVGYAIAWAGYNPPVDGAAPSFTYMGRFMSVIGLLPTVVMAIGIVIIFLFYKMTDEEAVKYAKINAEREAAAKAAKEG